MVYSSNQNIYKSNRFNTKAVGTTISTPYCRMYHFYDVFRNKGSTFYVLEYNDNNTNYNLTLWDNDPNLRDNGTLYPGCIVGFKIPLVNGKIGEVPVVVISNYAVICKDPEQYLPVPIISNTVLLVHLF